MKKLLILVLSALTLSLTSQAQKKSLGTPKTEQTATKAAQPSLSVPTLAPEAPVVDTVKVRVHYYSSTQEGLKFVSYEDGYVVRTTRFIPTSAVSSPQEVQNIIVNQRTGQLGVNRIDDKLLDKQYKPLTLKVQSVVPYDWSKE